MVISLKPGSKGFLQIDKFRGPRSSARVPRSSNGFSSL